MENKKLDNLFNAARQEKPMISFDEAMDMLHKKADETKYVGRAGIFRLRNIFLGALSVVVIVAGTYLALRNNDQQEDFVREQQIPDKGSANGDIRQQSQAAEIAVTVNNTSSIIASVKPEAIIEDKSLAAEVVPTVKPEVKNKDEHFGSIVKSAYLLENQTVNINNEKGKFKVHFNGNEVAKLEMDNTLLPQEEWSNFQDIIAEAKTVKSSMGINSGNAGNKKFVDFLFTTLKEKGLIENNLSSIRFSKDGLLVDGVEADSVVRQLLVDRYKALLGEEIGNRTLYFN